MCLTSVYSHLFLTKPYEEYSIFIDEQMEIAPDDTIKLNNLYPGKPKLLTITAYQLSRVDLTNPNEFENWFQRAIFRKCVLIKTNFTPSKVIIYASGQVASKILPKNIASFFSSFLP